MILQAYRATAFTALGLLQFTKAAFLEHAKRFREEEICVNMEGKNCIVTGSSSGLGFEAAKSLASRGATVYMVCRNKEKGEEALSRIKTQTGNPNIHLKIYDLSLIQHVKNCATEFTEANLKLHVLVNNAGVLEHERVLTNEGLEFNFATNVIGTYAMTELLLASLEKAAPEARVITVSSGGMYTAPLTDDLQSMEGKFNGTVQYARNKRIQVALTEKWARDYDTKGVSFYSMHPGWAATPGVAKSLPFLQTMQGILRTAEQGADTVVWLAMQPNEKLKSGSFYFDRAEAEKHLKFFGTRYTSQQVDSIAQTLRSICRLP